VQGRQGGGRGAVLLCRGGDCAPLLLCGGGLRKNAVCRTHITGQSGWGLGFRPVRGLTGPNKQGGPYPKPEYMYGYSYRRI
jgi:hypothetical protein